MTTNHIADTAAGLTVVASIAGYIPAAAAMIGICYYLILLWIKWPELRAEWKRRHGGQGTLPPLD